MAAYRLNPKFSVEADASAVTREVCNESAEGCEGVMKMKTGHLQYGSKRLFLSLCFYTLQNKSISKMSFDLVASARDEKMASSTVHVSNNDLSLIFIYI